jgi:putative acyl-CoA dehydrogenase
MGARHLAERIALLTQASLLIQHAPTAVADGFCASRLGAGWRGTMGSMALPQAHALIDRALMA